MILDPRIGPEDDAVARGVEFLLRYTKPDGGIHDGVLPSYNTAICVSALSHLRSASAGGAVERGVGYLRTLQYTGFAGPFPDEREFQEPVPESHPFFGGVGYGRHGRPDLSNLAVFLQAMRDAGVSSEDPAFKDALVFLRRVQMHGDLNEMPYAKGSEQGGFVYATTPDADSVDGAPGQSMAGEMVESLSDGTQASRLRAYGSMTYAGFKSLVYADLPPDDPRIINARRWIEANFTLDENPGMGDEGFYYYLVALARALDASGIETVRTDGASHDWRPLLVRALADLQTDDGSFRVRHPRWMEDDRVLITAYGLIALQHALR
jgi:squalene-hopene/tetraprenyl-beta-curcumene cyclase